MPANRMLDKDTPEDRIAALVDAIKGSPAQRDALLDLLPEQNPLYEGRGANQILHLRGYILAAFEQVGLPEEALPYVLDELQNGHDAYSVAGAARALRGLQNPSGEVVPFLFKAIHNIRQMDDALSFERYKPDWPLREPTTALREIFQTFKWLGANAQTALPELEVLAQDRSYFSEAIRREIREAIDAIRASKTAVSRTFVPLSLLDIPPMDEKTPGVVPAGLEFEDQATNRITYGEFFSRKPAVVVFFYTRCNNPNKCSLTIMKLGRLQQIIREEGLGGQLKTAAITYDPHYDLPARLRAYGRNRGVEFSKEHRFFRTLEGLKELQDYFGLGVNFSGSIPNQHRIELFILDDQGRIARTFARLQWDIHEVLDSAKALILSASTPPS